MTHYIEAHKQDYFQMFWEIARMDPFQDAVPCWQRYGMTQREIDLGLYGFTNRHY